MRFTTADSETRKRELTKVLEWQFAQEHNEDRFEMARRRVASNVEFGCITEEEATPFMQMIDDAERQSEDSYA